MKAEPSPSFPKELHTPRDSQDEFFRAASSSWDIWRNHTATLMPPLSASPKNWRSMPQVLTSLFHLLCMSQQRKVSVFKRQTGSWAVENFACPPLTIVLYPDTRAGPIMRSPRMVISEMTGASDEVSIAFLSLLRELGCECGMSLVWFYIGNVQRFAVQIGHTGDYFFADLVGGLLIHQAEEFACISESCKVEKSSDIFSMLLSFWKSKKIEPYTMASGRIGALYSTPDEPKEITVRAVFSGEDEIAMFWHFQAARRLSRPYINFDIAEAEEQNPAALAEAAKKADGDFTQVIAHLAEAEKIYASISKEGKERHAALAKKIIAALGAFSAASVPAKKA